MEEFLAIHSGDSLSRSFELHERAAAINLETGEFPLVAASDGEASDGHILSIKGAQLPKSAPLCTAHSLDPTLLLGSVFGFEKREHDIACTGRVNLTDDGTWLAETRRGLATLIASRDLRAVSVRWEALAWKRRIELPDGHPAKVAETETGPKRWGYLFEKWRLLEVSVCALGADPKALIAAGRSCRQPVASAFFRAVGRELERGEAPSDPILSAARAFAELDRAARAVRALGVEDADVANALGCLAGLEPEQLAAQLRAYSYRDGDTERRLYLPGPAYDALVGEGLEHLRAALRIRAEVDRAAAAAQPAGDAGAGSATAALSPRSGAPTEGDGGAEPPAGSTRGAAAHGAATPTEKRSVGNMTPEDFGRLLGRSLAQATTTMVKALRGQLY